MRDNVWKLMDCADVCLSFPNSNSCRTHPHTHTHTYAYTDTLYTQTPLLSIRVQFTAQADTHTLMHTQIMSA